MIPEHLAFEAFGPYLKRQEIDFAELAGAGLFLIFGETGSGKTVIFDAMSYALFGMSSGGARGDITGMRSGFAAEDQPTTVDFTFVVGRARYRFTRGVAVHVRRNGRKEYRLTQNAFFENKTGIFEPFFENPKIKNVRQKAEELLGLSYDQFRQVVLLPQGQFEKLLVADSAEKEQILVTLFGAEKWQKITDRLCDQAKAMKRTNDEMELAAMQLLGQYGCADGEELEEKLKETQQQQKTADREKDVREKAEETARRMFVEAQALNKQFVEHGTAQKRQEQLLAQEQSYRQIEQRLSRAADVQKVLPYRAEAARQNAQAAKRVQELDAAKTDMRDGSAQAEKAADRMYARQMYLQRQKEQLLLQKAQAKDKLAVSKKRYEALFDAYIRDMAARLSEGLEDGAPCPVCGSTQHPSKAAQTQNGASAAEVQQAEKMIGIAQDEIARIAERLMIAEHELAEGERLVGQLPDDRDFVPENGDKDRLLTLLKTARQKQETARVTAELAQKELLRTQADFDQAMQAYKGECAAHGFQNDEDVKNSSMTEQQIAEAREKLEQFHIDVRMNDEREAQLRIALASKAWPDMAQLTQSMQQATEERRQGGETCARITAQADMMRQTLAKVRKEFAALEKKKQEYIELDRFAKLLRGDLGVGLKRYVLGVMLSSITHEANKLLRKVHDGRYELFRTTEGSGRARKVGLDLEVFDANTGARRGVVGLSGGEKFLVSLALSLGLSAVVQAQSGGIHIDAMFIDEGFGSLDPGSIEDALDILASVKGGARLVGIISHVQMLRENIEASIQVCKTRQGSTLKINA